MKYAESTDRPKVISLFERAVKDYMCKTSFFVDCVLTVNNCVSCGLDMLNVKMYLRYGSLGQALCNYDHRD